MGGDDSFTPVVRPEAGRIDLTDLLRSGSELRRAPFFTALGEGLVERVLRLALARRCPDKVALYSDGDEGNSLFLIVRGAARMFVPSGAGLVEVARARPGEILGEAELLDGGRRFGAVVADGDLDVLEISRQLVMPELSEAVRAYLVDVRKARQKQAIELRPTLDR